MAKVLFKGTIVVAGEVQGLYGHICKYQVGDRVKITKACSYDLNVGYFARVEGASRTVGPMISTSDYEVVLNKIKALCAPPPPPVVLSRSAALAMELIEGELVET